MPPRGGCLLLTASCDVANAIGPLAAIFSVVKTKSVALQVEVPVWMLFIGGIAVGGGL